MGYQYKPTIKTMNQYEVKRSDTFLKETNDTFGVEAQVKIEVVEPHIRVADRERMIQRKLQGDDVEKLEKRNISATRTRRQMMKERRDQFIQEQ